MPLSGSAIRAAFAETTDEAFLVLLTIAHPDLAQPIRVVNNHVNVTSRGNVFIGCPFQPLLPDEIEGQLPRLRMEFDNISFVDPADQQQRRISDYVRAIATPFTVTLEVILGSTPDVVEAGPLALTAVHVEYDAAIVSAELALEDVLNEPYPGDSFVPSRYRGLF
jgi:hypothetical protein